MDNEMSFESLYMKGFGVESWENNRDTSTESYITDGFEEGAVIEMTQASESLDFIDAYSNIEKRIASDKIKMCKKLAVTYGMKSGVNAMAAKSIESLCRIQSFEAAEAAEEAGADTKVNDEDKPNLSFKEDKAKNGFWKAVWHAIVELFKKIGRFFKSIIDKIISFFKKDDKKEEEDLKVAAQNSAKASLSDTLGDVPDLILDFKDVGRFKGEKIQKFAKTYQKLASSVKKYETVYKDPKKGSKQELKDLASDSFELAESFDGLVDFKGLNTVKNNKNLEQATKYIKEFTAELQMKTKDKIAFLELMTGLKVMKNTKDKVELDPRQISVLYANKRSIATCAEKFGKLIKNSNDIIVNALENILKVDVIDDKTGKGVSDGAVKSEKLAMKMLANGALKMDCKLYQMMTDSLSKAASSVMKTINAAKKFLASQGKRGVKSVTKKDLIDGKTQYTE